MLSRTVAAAFALATALALPAVTSAAPTGSTLLVGAAASGSFAALPIPVQGSGLGRRSTSADGRYVAFTSDANGLLDNDDNLVGHVYRKDRVTGEVLLVSRATGADGAQNNEYCGEPTISSDGARVAFSCSQVLSPQDTNANTDVYVRDVANATTTLVSKPAVVNAALDGHSDDPEISGNGQYVVFTSVAHNLVSGGPATGYHVYRRQIGGANALSLVDDPNGAALPNDDALGASISFDGARVAFNSRATNLVAGLTDANGYSDVFWHDFATSTTAIVSCIFGNSTKTADGYADSAEISGNGLYVVYTSNATNIGDGDADTQSDVHRRVLASTFIVLVDQSTGSVKASHYASSPDVDNSGDVVAFTSASPDLDAAGAGGSQVYVRRINTGTTELVSRATGAGAAASSASGVSVSADGTSVVFVSRGLSADGDPSVDGVYHRALAAPRTTSLVSRPAGAAPFANAGGYVASEGPGSLSADGRYAVFTAAAAGLPGASPDGPSEAWRRDNLTGEVVLVSRAAGAAGAPADGGVYGASISADGNRVAFATQATNLVPAAPGAAVYVRDIASATVTVASRPTGAGGALNISSGGAISGDGNRVAFLSSDAQLGTGDSVRHVVVRDLAAQATTVVGAEQHDGDAASPQLDFTGARATWEAATDTGQGPKAKKIGGSSETHVWVSDVPGTPARVDALTDDDSVGPTISADGSRVAFATYGALVGADTNTVSDIYVRDLLTGSVLRASLTDADEQGDTSSYEAQISADGASVAFSSNATNLVPGDVNGVQDVFVRDLAAQTTVLASRADGPAGATGTRGAGGPAVSADGGCVLFDTDDTGYLADLDPGVSRLWLRAVHGTCPAAAAVAPGTTPPVTKPPVVTPPKARAPVVSRFGAKPKRFRSRGRQPGTRFTFTLNRAASVRITIARLKQGHRAGRLCRSGRPSRRQKACTIARTVATIKLNGRTGTNRYAFTGKVRKKALAKGDYRATLIATGAGLSSRPVALKLKVV